MDAAVAIKRARYGVQATHALIAKIMSPKAEFLVMPLQAACGLPQCGHLAVPRVARASKTVVSPASAGVPRIAKLCRSRQGSWLVVAPGATGRWENGAAAAVNVVLESVHAACGAPLVSMPTAPPRDP